MTTLIPAFVLSELKTAFIIGFVIFMPFLIIDLVVSSTLMSMGMFMLPPVLVSLPFKLLLFVMVDGWALVVSSLITSFHHLTPQTEEHAVDSDTTMTKFGHRHRGAVDPARDEARGADPRRVARDRSRSSA